MQTSPPSGRPSRPSRPSRPAPLSPAVRRADSRSNTTIGPGCSWLSLLASSSLGVQRVETTATEVRVEHAKLARGPMRLVVQTFEEGSAPNARPITSAQRSVTADELRQGVKMNLVDLSSVSRRAGGAQVLAWVEPGDANLEYDGRKARPGHDSLVGVGRSTHGPVKIVLHGRAALGRSDELVGRWVGGSVGRWVGGSVMKSGGW
jgi:hypothetical protein